jgi:hypothetical protein
MNVKSYRLTQMRRDGASPPRIWRISTDDGVVWLAEEGGRSRLIRLPLPVGDGDKVAYLEGVGRSPCDALALTAETEAAGRWVRNGRAPLVQPTTGD